MNSVRIAFTIALTITFQLAKAQQVLTVSGARIVTSPSTNIVVKGGITFTNGSVLKDSGDIFLKHNADAGRESWIDQVSGGVIDASSLGTVHFVSSQLQDIYGPGNFYKMRVSGDSGINIQQNISVKNTLMLDTGLVYLPNSSTLTVALRAPSAIQSTSNYTRSYVLGKLARGTSNEGIEYLFPIGKVVAGDSLYAPVIIEKVNPATVFYTAEYKPQTPVDQFNIVDPYILSISNVEYWDVTSNGTGTRDDAYISLSWRQNSQVPATDDGRDSLLVAQYRNAPEWGAVASMPNMSTVTGDANFGFVRSGIPVSNLTTAFPFFTLAKSIPLITLPLQVVRFEATKATDKNWLEWDVSTNQDARSFEVLKSTDAQTFFSLGKVSATNKVGNAQYLLPDNQPTQGWNYYQLKTISKNNKVSYSAIEKIYIESKQTAMKLYPNPTHDFTTLSLPKQGNYTMRIVNAGGQVVQQLQTTKQLVQLNLSKLTAGQYYVQVLEGGTITTLPLVKL